ncbi:MAG: hypothetical protein WC998_05465 [Candidatus Paceibacterota bacterium]|jgi:hypothetical protein
MPALIKSKFYELPKGATYVRVREERYYNGTRPKKYIGRKHDVFVGYTLMLQSVGKQTGEEIREYEIYHLRQWDFPICKPIDSGGCYTGDISGFTTGVWNEHCHPYEAITVDEMFKRMGISKESVITQ